MSRSPLSVGTLGLLGSVLVANPARAAECERHGPRDPGAPARIGWGPAGFGAVPEACAGTDVSLQADGALLVAADDFYGNLAASVALRLRYAFSDAFWLSLSGPGLDYRYVANATVTADSVDLGAMALGGHWSLPLGAQGRLAPYVRVLLPTETVFVNASRYGVDQGFSLAFRLGEKLELLGGATFPLLLTEASGNVHASYEPGLASELAYAPWSFFTLVGGATARLRFGDDRAFESLDPTLALRFFIGRRLQSELAARLPLFGADRTDAALALNVAWVFPR